MADPEPVAEQKPKSGMRKTLIIMLVVALVSGSAGFALPYILAGTSDEPTAAGEQPEAAGQPAFVPFGESVVNLDDGRMSRYLRVSITLQVDEQDQQQITESVETNKAILKSWLLSYISDKGMDDVRGAAGQNRMRREIQDHFNTVLFADGYDRIRDILFEEFNVQ